MPLRSQVVAVCSYIAPRAPRGAFLSPFPPMLICREFSPSRFRCNLSSFTSRVCTCVSFSFLLCPLISIIQPAGWPMNVQAGQILTEFSSVERGEAATLILWLVLGKLKRKVCVFWNGSFASRSIRAGISRGAPCHACMSELIVGRACNAGGLARFVCRCCARIVPIKKLAD